MDWKAERPAVAGLDTRGPAESPAARDHCELPRLRVAAELGLIAELTVETGGSEARAQSFYRCARWLETTTHDLRSLLRDHNLSVISADSWHSFITSWEFCQEIQNACELCMINIF